MCCCCCACVVFRAKQGGGRRGLVVRRGAGGARWAFWVGRARRAPRIVVVVVLGGVLFVDGVCVKGHSQGGVPRAREIRTRALWRRGRDVFLTKDDRGGLREGWSVVRRGEEKKEHKREGRGRPLSKSQRKFGKRCCCEWGDSGFFRRRPTKEAGSQLSLGATTKTTEGGKKKRRRQATGRGVCGFLLKWGVCASTRFLLGWDEGWDEGTQGQRRGKLKKKRGGVKARPRGGGAPASSR